MGGESGDSGLLWQDSNQVNDAAHIQLLNIDKGSSSLNLNGFNDSIGRLTLAAGTKVLTSGSLGGGVLTVRELRVDGQRMPLGIYTSSESWLQGSGQVIVGDVKRVEVSGAVDDPNKTIGAGNIALLKAATTLKLPDGDCSVHVTTGEFPLKLVANGKSRYRGVIAGKGGVRIEAAVDRRPFDIAGTQTNSYQGATKLRAAC